MLDQTYTTETSSSYRTLLSFVDRIRIVALLDYSIPPHRVLCCTWYHLILTFCVCSFSPFLRVGEFRYGTIWVFRYDGLDWIPG
jgi:hypothetical protein